VEGTGTSLRAMWRGASRERIMVRPWMVEVVLLPVARKTGT
jgi:hypothetical protein